MLSLELLIHLYLLLPIRSTRKVRWKYAEGPHDVRGGSKFRTRKVRFVVRGRSNDFVPYPLSFVDIFHEATSKVVRGRSTRVNSLPKVNNRAKYIAKIHLTPYGIVNLLKTVRGRSILRRRIKVNSLLFVRGRSTF